jgi:hypothetical protein
MKATNLWNAPTYIQHPIRHNWTRTMLQFFVVLVAGVVLLLFLLWLGLQIRPAPFPALAQPNGNIETMALPPNLPAPVARFYQKIYGDKIPVIHSAVITGWADVRPAGPAYIPARFRFIHDSGKGYRHYIEAGLYGLPLMQVDERYLDGHARGVTPFGVDEGAKVDQAANLGLWAETIWTPAVYLTTPRVRWETIDDHTARLVVPFKDSDDRFIVRFNPETGLIDWMESMRYQNQASPEKILWLNHAVEWRDLNDTLTNTIGAAIWMNNGTPWAIFHVDDIRLNVDVNEYIRATGP